jgi:hypothetical protein
LRGRFGSLDDVNRQQSTVNTQPRCHLHNLDSPLHIGHSSARLPSACQLSVLPPTIHASLLSGLINFQQSPGPAHSIPARTKTARLLLLTCSDCCWCCRIPAPQSFPGSAEFSVLICAPTFSFSSSSSTPPFPLLSPRSFFPLVLLPCFAPRSIPVGVGLRPVRRCQSQRLFRRTRRPAEQHRNYTSSACLSSTTRPQLLARRRSRSAQS